MSWGRIRGKCPYRAVTLYGDDGAVAMSVSARWGETAARDDLTWGHRAPTKSAALMLVVDASTPSPSAMFIHPIVSAQSNPPVQRLGSLPHSVQELQYWMFQTSPQNRSLSAMFWLYSDSFLPRCMECRRGLAMKILSVRQTRALWQNGRTDLFRFIYHTKDHLA